ncbi:MAG: DNA mismatch repair protein MutS [Candidatus Marinimicrobia bacterium]|nr:DNA mismatch repair protein MutS [Candidatus Neomarinimicrobiota bacterium]
MKSKLKKTSTPVMRQFWEAKESYPDSIMLFRMGDFYETFDEDAKIAAHILGITLTKRANGAASSVPLAGFPYHALDQYLYKLLNAGHRVAICEQVEDPKISKGIVKREVVEILSPGTAIADKYLNSNENNYLCSLYISDDKIGYSILDYSTGEFSTGLCHNIDLLNIIQRFNIKEVIVSDRQEKLIEKIKNNNIIVSNYKDWIADSKVCYDKLLDHFQIRSLKGFGIEKDDLLIIASGAAIFYVENNFFGRIKHITSLSKISDDNFMRIDSFTLKNLEIFKSLSDSKGTLINSIDNTITPMGSRLLKYHIKKPLINKKQINLRLDFVDELIKNKKINIIIREELKMIADIPRILGKISTNKFNPRDLINLSDSLDSILSIKNVVLKKLVKNKKIFKDLNNTNKISKLIKKYISIDAPVNIKNGGVINVGVCSNLDELREISDQVNSWLVNYQESEKKRTEIPSLKINYNRVFGYYIDITKTHIDKVPDEYIRKQTLTNSERYFTEELKEYEDKILNAKDRIIDIEETLLIELVENILVDIVCIQNNSKIISEIDVFSSHAYLAENHNYCKPVIKNFSKEIRLKKSRHPVIEQLLPLGEKFIPNDLDFGYKNKQIGIITGPNMAGKSTYLRQIGIISILSQIGSFVPAEKAEVSIVDQLFIRVGASDNLSQGESTFLVEMNETANILNNATKNSLIILDEIGRGTSTYDGLSIAWSIIEYLHNNSKIKAKTLFATHYHELINLANELSDAFNLNVLVKEQDEQIYFLRKIEDGGASKSYGINVAKMAGIPSYVTSRSKELLEDLTQNKKQSNLKVSKNKIDLKQIEIFDFKDEILRELKNIDIESLTPIQAINKLNDIKKKL